MRSGKRFKKLTTSIKTKKVPNSFCPLLGKTLYRYGYRSVDDKITISLPAILNGSRLSFNAGDLKQGSYFVSGDNAENKVKTIHKITYSQLLFLNPTELPAGQFRLVIKSSLNVKDISVCTHNKTFKV